MGFNQVGVDARLQSGWFTIQYESPGGTGTSTFYPGQFVPAGFVVPDAELVVRELKDGYPFWENRSRVMGTGGVPPGGIVTFPGGILGAAITGHAIGTASKEVTVNYFHIGFLGFDIGVNIVLAQAATPTTVTNTPPPTQTEFTASGPTHWSDIGLGGRGTDTLNSGRSVSGSGCVIDNVILELLDKNGTVLKTAAPGQAAVVYFGAFHGFSWGRWNHRPWNRHHRRDGYRSLVVRRGNACRYRVRYFVTGNNCSA